MAHLKHSGPIRQAAHAKRTALVEIYSDEPAVNDESIETSAWPMPSLEPIKAFRDIEAEANEEARAIVRGDLSEADLIAIDRAVEAAKADGSLTRWRDERALAEQMQRGRTGI